MMSFTTAEAIMSPAAEGTKEMLAGGKDLSEHARFGSSFEYTTFNEGTPLLRSSARIALASGHTEVLYISEISKAVGSSLFPVPIEDIIGMPRLYESSASASLVLTVSIASTI